MALPHASAFLSRPFLFLLPCLTVLTFECRTDAAGPAALSGELMVWHPLTLTLTTEDPFDEQGRPNPFLDARLEVTFSRGERRLTVPGYFAADGRAAETGASAGKVWRAHFTPDEAGEWTYAVSFRRGRSVAVSDDPEAGEAVGPDGLTGSFRVAESDKQGRDFRARGRLDYVGRRYLQFAGTEAFFLKGGADSPENFLGYVDFDGTYYGGNREHRQGESAPNLGLHAYAPHLGDWRPGDPSWRGGKGKGIVGALNYLAGKGMNSVYMLTMNVQGDGDDVWPWTDRNERYRFDCSKLDQWNIVFDHMDSLGLMQHFILQETENETILDGGHLDVQRKLYLRELVARFAQHPAITWNLGEEHFATNWSPAGQTVQQTKDMADYLRAIDPYDHFIVVHTHSGDAQRDEDMYRLLGFPAIEGPSIQVGDPTTTHRETLEYIRASADSSHQWVVCLDEIGPAWKGALPDAEDPAHDTIRHHVLWGNLMAGGGGVEWYFGYRFAHNDLNLEDWRSRDRLWDQTRHALDFFHQHLPFADLRNHDELAPEGAYCLAREGEMYALYLPPGTRARLDLRGASGEYAVSWYDPRNGGALQSGAVTTVSGGRRADLGAPPGESDHDWVLLLNRM